MPSSRPLTFAIVAALCASLVVTSPLEAQHAQTGPDAPERVVVQKALEGYIEGLIAQDAGPIPLASDVIFVKPDGTSETTLKGIDEVAPFLERQTVDSIRVHHTVIDGEWGCELTDYFWTDGPKMPIALCLRVRNGKITEIRPYFDRSLFSD